MSLLPDELPSTPYDLRADAEISITGRQNSYLVKRKALGKGAVFSRDPLNLTNIHAKKVCLRDPNDIGRIVLTLIAVRRLRQRQGTLE